MEHQGGLTEEVTLEPGLEGREEQPSDERGEASRGKAPSGAPGGSGSSRRELDRSCGGGYLNFGFCTQYARSHWRV